MKAKTDRRRASRGKKALWRCPLCGHRFVTRNIWHSCRRYRLADHFSRAEPHVHALFRKFAALVRSCGSVHMYPQKTRIVFMVRVRFAGVAVRKAYLVVAFWLTRKVEHPRILRVLTVYPTAHIHEVRLNAPADLDATFRGWIREAYAVGQQKHLIASSRRD